MTIRSNPPEPPKTQSDPQKRVHALGLWGILANWERFSREPWIATLIECEEHERARRSLERRVRNAKIGTFKPVADFDWKWPRSIDRDAIDDALSLKFVDDGSNLVFYGSNGVGKTMLLKNIAHLAVLQGYTVRCVTASEMLADLAAQDTTSSLSRRVARYVQPLLLCIDEVGYLSYDSRYADLLFEVVSRRYQAQRSIVLTTNKRFADWPQVFPNAACVVTLVDRLLHRCECIEVDADSYRFKEAREREEVRAKSRASRRNQRASTTKAIAPSEKRK